MRKGTFFAVVTVPVLLVIAVLVYGEFIKEDDRPIINRAAQPAAYQLTEVASGFDNPLFVTHAGDGSERLFVVEQTGKILIMRAGVVQAAPFLDVSELLHPDALSGSYSERGLLGLAFDPNYAENGIFYVNYSDQQGRATLARYAVSADDADQADPASAEILMTVDQPYSNHNGGHLAFGPLDGYLYMALGDGGSGGDPRGNGQNLATLLGTIIRLDVSGTEGYAVPLDNPFVEDDTAQPEIWIYGVRNPWRFSFDRETGDLYIADVGQGAWEEVHFQAANSPGGENYGWNVWEGTHRYSDGSTVGDAVMPVLEYGHEAGRCSVTGGYVYRGAAVPALAGYYFYGDWCSGTIWAAQPAADGSWTTSVSLESGRSISSFGEDEAGELYLVDYRGSVLRFDPVS